MKSGIRFAAFAAATFALGMVAATQGETVSFQEGVDGYTGTVDVFIGLDENDIPGEGDGNVDGSTLAEDFIDGRYYDPTQDDNGFQEIQLLLRFDNVFGAGAGQIPLGAPITSASLRLTSGASSGDAQSGGPYGVAQLLVPFDTTTTWNSITPLGNGSSLGGATYGGGQNERPLDKGFRGPLDASDLEPFFAFGNMTQVVRNWSVGAANLGIVIRAGTTNGWQVFTTGGENTALRPLLEVTFDTSSQPTTTTTTLQQNVGGYSGTTMAWLQDDDITDDGEFLDQEFLDGPNLGDSPDDQALIKFANIFVSEGGSVPDDATILEANLLVDTGGALRSVNIGTNGNFAVHQMLVDWNLSSLFSDFNGDGPTEADGEIDPASDLTGALIADARSQLDVTDAVQAWQSGEPNYGLNIQAVDTSDGWGINWLGSLSPPQLAIRWTTDFNDADFDQDGDVDGDDFLLWQTGFGIPSGAEKMDGDFDDDGDVDGDDFLGWQANFGSGDGAGSSAVPEPATLAIALLIACLVAVRRRFA